MLVFRIMLLLLLTLTCTTITAGISDAPFGNLRAVDNPTTAGRPVAARMLYFFCYTAEEIQSSTVQVTGNVVTLTVQMRQFPPDLICFSTPPPPEDIDFAIGSFSQGEYTLVVRTLSSRPGVTYPELTTTFSVGAAVPIPVLSLPMMLLLSAALLLCARVALSAAYSRRYATGRAGL